MITTPHSKHNDQIKNMTKSYFTRQIKTNLKRIDNKQQFNTYLATRVITRELLFLDRYIKSLEKSEQRFNTDLSKLYDQEMKDNGYSNRSRDTNSGPVRFKKLNKASVIGTVLKGAGLIGAGIAAAWYAWSQYRKPKDVTFDDHYDSIITYKSRMDIAFNAESIIFNNSADKPIVFDASKIIFNTTPVRTARSTTPASESSDYGDNQSTNRGGSGGGSNRGSNSGKSSSGGSGSSGGGGSSGNSGSNSGGPSAGDPSKKPSGTYDNSQYGPGPNLTRAQLERQGIDPLLVESIFEGTKVAFGDPNDPTTRYVVQINNAKRNDPSSKHGQGKAADVQIYDRQAKAYVGGTNNIFSNALGNAQTYRMFEVWAQGQYKYLHDKYGEKVANRLTSGLYFKARQNGSFDNMHISLDEHGRQGSIRGGASQEFQNILRQRGAPQSEPMGDVSKWQSPYNPKNKPSVGLTPTVKPSPTSQPPKSKGKKAGIWTSLEKPPTPKEVDDALATGKKFFDFDVSGDAGQRAARYIQEKGGNVVAYNRGPGNKQWNEGAQTNEQIIAQAVASGQKYIHLDNISEIGKDRATKLVDGLRAAGKIVIPKNAPKFWNEYFKNNPDALKETPYAVQENISTFTGNKNSSDKQAIKELNDKIIEAGGEGTVGVDWQNATNNDSFNSAVEELGISSGIHMKGDEFKDGYEGRNGLQYDKTQSSEDRSHNLLNNYRLFGAQGTSQIDISEQFLKSFPELKDTIELRKEPPTLFFGYYNPLDYRKYWETSQDGDDRRVLRDSDPHNKSIQIFDHATKQTTIDHELGHAAKDHAFKLMHAREGDPTNAMATSYKDNPTLIRKYGSMVFSQEMEEARNRVADLADYKKNYDTFRSDPNTKTEYIRKIFNSQGMIVDAALRSLQEAAAAGMEPSGEDIDNAIYDFLSNADALNKDILDTLKEFETKPNLKSFTKPIDMNANPDYEVPIYNDEVPKSPTVPQKEHPNAPKIVDDGNDDNTPPKIVDSDTKKGSAEAPPKLVDDHQEY